MCAKTRQGKYPTAVLFLCVRVFVRPHRTVLISFVNPRRLLPLTPSFCLLLLLLSLLSHVTLSFAVVSVFVAMAVLRGGEASAKRMCSRHTRVRGEWEPH